MEDFPAAMLAVLTRVSERRAKLFGLDGECPDDELASELRERERIEKQKALIRLLTIAERRQYLQLLANVGNPLAG